MNQAERAIEIRNEYDKKLALALEKGYKLHGENGKELLTNIYQGLVRLSWYSSCLFDDYQDVCSKLRGEDARHFQSIAHGYSQGDATRKIITLFFNYLLSRISDEQIDRIYNRMKQDPFLRGHIHKLGIMVSGSVTKKALTYGLVNFTIGSRSLGRLASGFSSGVFSLIEHYGLLQERIASADSLKRINPEFYQILYKEGLETWWYFVEPVLRRYLSIPSYSEDTVYNAIMYTLRSLE
ncbi:hypothetical protein HQN64_11225 [Enterobacteriaceae bacterium BIT-l23]|uniref:hypothetical protein n=1 Tax=Jejubacter sp. L23 TaxID=3092086 RepID=UPI001585AC7D|nr:hypothetical protein [Enterobacteriaceae bacterium BIT-l23]